MGDILGKIQGKIAEAAKTVAKRVEAWVGVRDPIGFRGAELEIASVCRDLADEVTASVLEQIVSDPALQAEASLAARQGGRFRHGGSRQVEITLLGGKKVRLKGIEYLKPNRRGRPGRPRKSGNRGEGGVGSIPSWPCSASGSV